MPFYRCLLRGENFVWRKGSDWELMGFYANRWVRALNPKAAEDAVIAKLREESIFQRPVGYSGGPPAEVFVEEIERVRLMPLRRGGGATWFVMEE
jgi:hypothetical protein